MKKLIVLILCVMVLTGSAPAFAQDGGMPSSGMIAWSPDGRWIAYPCAVRDPRDSKSYNVWRVCISDSNGERLSVSSSALKISDWGPEISWSPDSSKVAFMCYVNDRLYLCIADRAFERMVTLKAQEN